MTNSMTSDALKALLPNGLAHALHVAFEQSQIRDKELQPLHLFAALARVEGSVAHDALMAAGVPSDLDELWEGIWQVCPRIEDGVTMGSPVLNPHTCRIIEEAKAAYWRDGGASESVTPSLYILMAFLRTEIAMALLFPFDTALVGVWRKVGVP